MTKLSARQDVTLEYRGIRSDPPVVACAMTEALPAGTKLGNYELIRLLAQGGMADIYLARQIGLDRQVAVKVLNTKRAEDPDSRTLFMDEARLVGMLSHENLASVYEVAVEAGIHYLAMEYVDGADLRELLARAQVMGMAIPYGTALTIVAHTAAGLDYAHRKDVDGRPLRLVHRDVSLSNIMITMEGAVKLIDFGIAISTASQHHTNPGIVRGKASYMAPEQAIGDPCDARTDVFALGVVLYELCTGMRCFPGNSDFERMLAVVRGEFVPPSVHVPEIPAALEQVICTALSLDPAYRFETAGDMIEALEAVAALEGWRIDKRATARLMFEVYPPDDRWEDDTELVAPPTDELEHCIAVPNQETVIITKRRLARGTESDAPEPSDWEDEARTRGRRAIPRWAAA